MSKTRARQFLALLSLMSFVLVSCAQKQETEPISETRLLLNTICTITLYDTQDRAILTEAFELCEKYEKMLSITIEGSDIWRINHAQGSAVEVSVETIEIIKAGLLYSELSKGMFDITIGRVGTLWDYSGESGVPLVADILSALETVDYRQVHIAGNTVQLDNPEAWIDLGAIAKGYIADRLIDFLKEKGVNSAIVDLGGNVVTIGTKPDGSFWLIGVARPFSSRDSLLGIVETGEASIVSSGVYERQFVENGQLYHHILDPFTGMPVQSNVVSATIVSTCSMSGDALSTIAILFGITVSPETHEASRMGLIEILEQDLSYIGVVILLDDGEVLQFGDISFK
jgi:thiamine biosynthesis lipoprotein